MSRLLYVAFLILLNSILAICNIYAFLRKGKKPRSLTSIAAFPYLASGYPGGAERIANWKSYFEQDGIKFDVHWAFSEAELEQQDLQSTSFHRYWLFTKILLRRSVQLFRLHNYDAVWVQRAFVPEYPFKNAYFERVIKKINKNFIIDYYDANYVNNKNLTINSVKAASTVTTATVHLTQFLNSINPNTHFIRMSVSPDLYRKKSDYNYYKILKIGWMGNPGNALHLAKIEDQLQKIEQSYPFVEFHFVCRKLPDLKLNHLHIHCWGNEHFDYYQWLATIDIGIVPYIGEDEVLKAKPAMKTLEFMVSGIPIVASIWGSFDQMQHGRDYLLAKSQNDWYQMLEQLINSESMREEIGMGGLRNYYDFHSYDKVYNPLKTALTPA